jgi:hypothetical protein
MSAKLVTSFADRECRVVSATDPEGRGAIDEIVKYTRIKQSEFFSINFV